MKRRGRRLPTGWNAPFLVNCPFCGSFADKRPRTCCVCKGARRVTFQVSLVEMQNVWSRDGCECDVCRDVRAVEFTIWLRPPYVKEPAAS